jgi:predicted outer membrane repeat protein
MKRLFLGILALAFCLGCGPKDSMRPPLPSTYVVMPDSSGDFPTIQAAIDGVPPRSLILLHDGVFTGPGNIDLDFKGKALTIRSQSGDPTACVIECRRPMAPVECRAFHFHSGEAADSKVDGLLIRNGNMQDGAAVLCEGSSPVFTRCVFIHNLAMASLTRTLFVGPLVSASVKALGGAVHCYQASPVFDTCTFIDNTADYGGALCASRLSFPIIRHTTFHRNRAFLSGSAIACFDTATVTIDSSLLAHGEYGAAVAAWWGGVVTVSCTDIFGNVDGDWTYPISGQRTQRGNRSVDPLICNVDSVALTLQASSPLSAANDPCGLIGAWEVACRK